MTATATTTHAFHVRLADWTQDRAQLQAVREAVFVREQNIPAELEWDEAADRTCIHVLALDHANRPIGTARLKPDGQIGRMAVVAPWRRRRVGTPWGSTSNWASGPRVNRSTRRASSTDG